MYLTERDPLFVIIRVETSLIQSKPYINVLGVTFDSKLQWDIHVNNAIRKANKEKNAIRLICKFFNNSELSNLLMASFFSVHYYSADICLIPTLKSQIKQLLLSASASSLKICLNI
jgi:hypothetical protein